MSKTGQLATQDPQRLIQLRLTKAHEEFTLKVRELVRTQNANGGCDNPRTLAMGNELLCNELESSMQTIVRSLADSLIGSDNLKITNNFLLLAKKQLAEAKINIESIFDAGTKSAMRQTRANLRLDQYFKLDSQYELAAIELEVAVLKIIDDHKTRLGSTPYLRLLRQAENHPILGRIVLVFTILLALGGYFNQLKDWLD